jgi:hypothetical protein
MVLVLGKGSHQMGFQVDQAAYKILVLVKGDCQMRSQVNSTAHKDFSFG